MDDFEKALAQLDELDLQAIRFPLPEPSNLIFCHSCSTIRLPLAESLSALEFACIFHERAFAQVWSAYKRRSLCYDKDLLAFLALNYNRTPVLCLLIIEGFRFNDKLNIVKPYAEHTLPLFNAIMTGSVGLARLVLAATVGDRPGIAAEGLRFALQEEQWAIAEWLIKELDDPRRIEWRVLRRALVAAPKEIVAQLVQKGADFAKSGALQGAVEMIPERLEGIAELLRLRPEAAQQPNGEGLSAIETAEDILEYEALDEEEDWRLRILLRMLLR